MRFRLAPFLSDFKCLLSGQRFQMYAFSMKTLIVVMRTIGEKASNSLRFQTKTHYFVYGASWICHRIFNLCLPFLILYWNWRINFETRFKYCKTLDTRDVDWLLAWFCSTMTSLVISGSTFSSCAQRYKSGQNISGIYSINPGSGVFDVFCDHTTAGGGWTVFQKLETGRLRKFLPRLGQLQTWLR